MAKVCKNVMHTICKVWQINVAICGYHTKTSLVIKPFCLPQKPKSNLKNYKCQKLLNYWVWKHVRYMCMFVMKHQQSLINAKTHD